MSEMDMYYGMDGQFAFSPLATPGADLDSPYREGSADTPRRWKRVRRPFKELADKILHEMRRKDAYGFFLEPVSLDDYPDYLARIGGADKAMDLGTMQKKVNNGLYRNIDQLEADFRKVVDAAKAFNLPGTMPVREATKMFTHGMKHIDRARPLVLTPTPSPSPKHSVSALPESGPSTPRPDAAGSSKASKRVAQTEKETVPKRRIPSQMLEFPPNSSQALAVGWNQTGGRRVRAKRLVRGRERFTGRWRDWCPDGSRDIAEMDDPAGILDELRHRNGEDMASGIDWARTREDGEWWEWDGLGGPTGQPPLPGSDRLKPPTLRRRRFEHLDFGPYPLMEKEMTRLRQEAEERAERFPDADLIGAHLRPASQTTLPTGLPPQNFTNIYDRPPPLDYLYNVCMGGVAGEAYARSVQRFLDGAITGAEARASAAGKPPSETAGASAALRSHVAAKWHDGVVQGPHGALANDTVRAVVDSLRDPPTKPAPSIPGEPLTRATAPAAIDRAYARIALRDLTSARNPLNLAPLLRDPTEFLYPGIGGKNGPLQALEWISGEIGRLAAAQDAARKKKDEKEKEKEKEVKEVKVESVPNGAAAEPMDVDTAPAVDAVPATSAPAAQVVGVKRPREASEEPAFGSEEREAKRSRVGSPSVTTNGTVPADSAAPAVVAEVAPAATPVPGTPSSAGVPSTTGAAVPATVPTAVTATTPAPIAAAVPAPAPAGDSVPTPTAAAAAPTPSAPTSAPVAEPAPDSEEALRQLRLELVAVSKFYPLASLKKMSKDQAKKLLPASVRGLMTRND
jgi:hypothetical protein